MKYIYSAVFTPTEDGIGFYASVPDLPGCSTTGSSMEDAITQITDAASLWLTTAEDLGDTIPAASEQAALTVPKGAALSLIRIDTLAYRTKTDTRCVRKNVSLPAWLSAMAEQRNINVSQVLQEALKSKLDTAYRA